MLAYDYDRFPGGKMAGFMIWINQKWNEFARAVGVPRSVIHLQPGFDSHARFDEWLRSGVS